MHLPGSRPHEEIPAWLNAADVFSLPSYAEGLPNSVLEAMACGLPVVASDVGGIPEVVRDGETGILVGPACVDSLERALTRLVENPGLRASMGSEGRKVVEDRFRWEMSARRVLEVYESVSAEASMEGCYNADG